MKKPSAMIGTFFLILTLAGCSLPGNVTPGRGNVTPVPGNATPLSESPTPTSIPAPLPSGFTDLLQVRIASGEWTLETGLVTMLKLFVGEMTAGQAGLGLGVLETEGTGILQLAGSYLQTGSDQVVKDEITRLVDLLVPTQEALDQYSIPEEQASGSNPRQAAPLKQEEVKCETLWEDGFPDPLTPKFPCFLKNHGTVGLDSYMVYYPSDWRGDTSREAYLAATLDAIQASFTEYRHYGSVKPIYFVFSTREQTVNLDTLVWSYYELFRPASEACPVIIFPAALTTLDILDYKQKIAHEIFHCFQVRNLHDQLLGPGLDSNWWSEGTAEYFSNLVYPKVNLEHRYTASFSISSTRLPLTGMGHENFAFFQFMGTTLSPEGVFEILTSMPVTTGRDAQDAALAAVLDIDVYFEEFVRSVLDNTLLDTDGSAITFPISYTGQSTFFEITSRVFSSQQPFVVSRYWVTFAGEKEYALFVETLDYGGEGHSGARYIDGKKGDWAPLPESVGGCDPLHYVLYVINTTPGSEHTQTVSTTMVIEAPCDRCLIGGWQATNESVIAYMQSVASAAGNTGVVVEIESGTMLMHFEADGTGAGGYKDLVLRQTGGAFVAGSEAFVTFDGSSSGRYTADGSLLTGLSDAIAITVSVEVIVNGTSLGSTTIPFTPENFPVGTAYPTPYTCEGDTLTTRPQVEGVTVEPVVWTRSSP